MIASHHDEASGLGVYLYCLARPECVAAVQRLPERDLHGVDERFPVMARAEAGVAAVIGDVAIGEFSDQNLQTLSWVAPRAGRHEAVVERIMDVSPVLPARFGTIFRSQASLTEFLDRHSADIVRGLEDLQSKSEWSVKGYLVEEEARRVVAAADSEIQTRLAALSPSPGARYLQQKQLQAMMAVALETAVARVSQDLHQTLASHAAASTALRCHTSVVTGRQERMVFNSSFLLTADRLPDFRATLSRQQDCCQGIGLSLELRGPWPPYHLCPDLSGN